MGYGFMGFEKDYRKRSEAWKPIAAILDLTFSFSTGPGFLDAFRNVSLFKDTTRNSERIYNHIHGSLGTLDLRVFEFHAARVRLAIFESILLFTCADLQLPRFHLQPKPVLYNLLTYNFLSKLLEYNFTGPRPSSKDIYIDTTPDFFRHYLLRGDDGDAIRQLFSPEIVSFFLDRKGKRKDGNRGLWVIGDGPHLFYGHDIRLLPLGKIKSFAQSGLTLFEHLAKDSAVTFPDLSVPPPAAL